MTIDPAKRREKYRAARTIEYGAALVGVYAAYLGLTGEWRAMLTALALAGVVYATGYFERVTVAMGDEP